MNVQLYLSNQLVELEENITFPLNKTFDDITNPTSIITEYSKTINIPMTKRNNAILGDIYRLDRVIKVGDTNIGIYFDPSKKIPFQLLYNGDLLFEGYAKFLNASYSVNDKYYSITLYSSLGNVFKKLKEVVVDPLLLTQDQLSEPDGGKKYVLDDLLSGDLLTSTVVTNGWRKTPRLIDIYTNLGGDYDIIGFIPAYRGYYKNDWASDKAEWTNPTTGQREIVLLSDILNYKWKQTYKQIHPSATDEEVNAAVEALDAPGLIGDGLKDYQLGSYRCYELRPYILMSALMQLFQKKCKELTGYDMVLDSDFFTARNPYYVRMCYTLDYLGTNSDDTLSKQIYEGNSYSLTSTSTFPDITANTYTKINTINVEFDTGNSVPNEVIIIDPITISSTRIYTEGGNNTGKPFGSISAKNPFALRTEILVYGKDSTGTYNLVSSRTFFGIPQGTYFRPSDFGYSVNDKVIEMNTESTYEQKINIGTGAIDMILRYSNTYTIPKFVVSGAFEYGVKIVINTGLQYGTNPYIYTNKNGGVTSLAPVLNDVSVDYMATTSISYQSKWRTNLRMKLPTFYQKTDPIFNVVLQYTKMFGLVWDIDDVEKKVYIKTRNNYFKNYTVSNWDDKVDRTRDVSVEPVSFDVRFVNFGYDKLEGYNLSEYYKRTGEEYGAKRINTEYEFNRDSKQMIEEIYPTCCSSRSFLTFKTMLDWDLQSPLYPTLDDIPRLDCDNQEGDDVEYKSNWVLHTGSKFTSANEVMVTDDSELQLTNNEYCYIYEGGTQSFGIPKFNIALKGVDNKYIGCTFGTPLFDYTVGKEPTLALDNYIYDNYWKAYIDERYNIQNKKVTLYLNISPLDYINFRFNHFITISNQLFMINKIIDYDPVSRQTTKCELIQVTNPLSYSNGQVYY